MGRTGRSRSPEPLLRRKGGSDDDPTRSPATRQQIHSISATSTSPPATPASDGFEVLDVCMRPTRQTLEVDQSRDRRDTVVSRSSNGSDRDQSCSNGTGSVTNRSTTRIGFEGSL